MASKGRRITSEEISLTEVLGRVKDPSAGGTVVFIGTIRRKGDRGPVTGLDYQVYGEMAERRMKKIESEVKKRWPVKKVALVHREGSLAVGDVSVVVAVSSVHRKEAFEACRYAIDRIKSTLPIWKKERSEPSGRWVEGTPIKD